MARAHWSAYRRDRLKALPFVVEAPQTPGASLGQRLSHMMAWCSEHVARDSYGTSFREDRNTWDAALPIGFVIWHFADEQTAKNFAAHFDLAYLPPGTGAAKAPNGDGKRY
jgi:hypothetical protein